MIDIDSMKSQHSEISKVMADAVLAIDRGAAPSEAEAIRHLLQDISMRVRMHLETEDRDVYPILVQSDDPEVRRKAQQFRTNMGGLAEEFRSYFQRYASPAEIGRDPWLFSYETRRIFDRLKYRMRREENDLYPLLKSAEPAATEH